MRYFIFSLLAVFAVAVSAAPKPPAPGPLEIVLRHDLSGDASALLIDLAERFNAEGKTDRLVVEHLSMVPDPHRLPHLVLLDDDEHARFFDGRPRMLPLYKAMAEGGQKLDPARLLPVMADAIDDDRRRLRALPLAFSVPVLYYNRDAFRKAKLDPQQPPATWWTLQTAAGTLFDAGIRCPFTSSNPAWVQMENVTTQHNEPLANAERGGKTRLALNGLVQVKHVALLASWHKSFYFHYFGRGREADQKFAAGTCAMLTSDSALYAQLARSRPFDLGVAAMPHYDDVRGAAPGRVLPDGAALWVLAGKKKPEYAAVARFVSFMLRPDVQRVWVRTTGYLPMIPEAVDALAAEGDAPEALRKLARGLAEKKLVTGARPRFVLGLERARAILNEELESVWANRKPAKEALDSAVARGNAALQPLPPDGAGGK